MNADENTEKSLYREGRKGHEARNGAGDLIDDFDGISVIDRISFLPFATLAVIGSTGVHRRILE